MLKIEYVKKSLLLAIPLVITQMANAMNGFVGTLMLAKLGHDVLAASALLFAVSTAVVVISMSPLFALGVLVSQANGRNDHREIGNLMQQAWIFGLLLILIPALIYWQIGAILLFFHQKNALITILVPYFHAALWGLPAVALNISSNQFVFGVKKPLWGLSSSIVNMLTTLTAGYILILGKLGVPSFGVEGWGMAFVIGSWASFIFLSGVLFFNPVLNHFHLFKAHIRNEWQHLKLLFSVGWPIVIQTGGELLSLFFITMMIGWLTKTDLAASQITQQYMLLIIIPFFGISGATSILVGNAAGKKNIDDIKILGDTNTILGILYTLVFMILFIIFHKALLGIFINKNEVDAQQIYSLSVMLMMIRIVGLMFDSVRNVLTGALRGLLDTRYAMIVSVASIWLFRMPLAYFLGFTLSYGVIGISISNIIAMFFGSLFLWLRWRKKLNTLSF